MLGTFIDGLSGSRIVDCIIALWTDLYAGVGRVVDVSLDWERLLAVLPTEPTIIICITCVACAGSHAGPGDILPIGVDLDWTKVRTESSSGVSPVPIITDVNTGLVDLAAETSIRAGVGTHVKDHIGVYILYFRAVSHTLTSSVVGE